MKKGLLVFFFFSVLVLDQISKHVIAQYLIEGQSISIIPGLFDLTLVRNRGAAFGMFHSLPDRLRRITITFVTVVALGVVMRLMLRETKNDQLARVALVGILAGAVGNIIDRVRFDSVVDFIDVYWKSYHWPAFNVADSMISVGVVILMVRFLLGGHNSPKIAL